MQKENIYSERRSYDRINDVIGVRFTKIIPRQERDLESNKATASLLPGLTHKIDKELDNLRPALNQLDPVIAQAFDLLNRKLQLISLNQSTEEFDLGRTDVSLSASGIAFGTDTSVTTGSRLALALSLNKPSEPVLVLGQVLACEPQVSKYWIRIKFSEADHSARRALAEYIHKKGIPSAKSISLSELYSRLSKSKA